MSRQSQRRACGQMALYGKGRGGQVRQLCSKSLRANYVCMLLRQSVRASPTNYYPTGARSYYPTSSQLPLHLHFTVYPVTAFTKHSSTISYCLFANLSLLFLSTTTTSNSASSNSNQQFKSNSIHQQQSTVNHNIHNGLRQG